MKPDNPFRKIFQEMDKNKSIEGRGSKIKDREPSIEEQKYKTERKKTVEETDNEADTSLEAQVLADQYNVAVRDVIDYLNSVEGKKGQKYEAAKDHFDRLRLEKENQRLRSFFSMNIPPATVSSSDNHKKSDDNGSDNNGYDADIKYQRDVASAWGPFLMMRNLNPTQDNNAIKREIEELKESNKELESLLYSVLSGNQGKKNGDPIDNMRKFLGLFKGIKEVLGESEAERQKKIEEETKQKQIEANKEKVSMLLNAVKHFSPMPEHAPSVPVYRSADALPSYKDAKKVNGRVKRLIKNKNK